jgi:hypothetical protein
MNLQVMFKNRIGKRKVREPLQPSANLMIRLAQAKDPRVAQIPPAKRWSVCQK